MLNNDTVTDDGLIEFHTRMQVDLISDDGPLAEPFELEEIAAEHIARIRQVNIPLDHVLAKNWQTVIDHDLDRVRNFVLISHGGARVRRMASKTLTSNR